MQVSQESNESPNFSRTPIAAGIVLALASPALLAQDALQIEEVIVTAQKRSENLQDVPISIQALGSQAIEELNLTNFKDYTQMLPSVAMTPTLGAGSSFNLVYMRGVSTGGDGQATTSQPSVGMYLDELSMTTIQGNIDVHMYDIARVEALAGPQGTLYGASSQAGTLRVITNKPDPSGFSSSFSAGVNTVEDGGDGYSFEGHVNAPIGDSAAVRLVGWQRSDAGWIDNVLGSRTHEGVKWSTSPVADDPLTPADETVVGILDPSDDITLTNTDKVKKDYNTLDTIGARGALRIDLGDNWTVSPTAMYQKSESEGAWGDDLNRSQTITSDSLASSDYAVTHFQDEFFDDEWSMLGLTIEGSIGNFDVVYAGSYLDREVQGSTDYTDYSYWYDVYGTTGYYADIHFADTGARALPNQFANPAECPNFPAAEDPESGLGGCVVDPATVGSRVMTGARFSNDDRYSKTNHELRISTDPSKRVRGLIGLFSQKQYHDFEQHWEVVGGVAASMQMNGGIDSRFKDTVYLNSMYRTDRDTAYFGSVSFDINDNVEATVGARFFEPEVHVKGFFGFPEPYQRMWGTDGETQCDAVVGGTGDWDDGATSSFNGQTDWKDKPCLNVDKKQDESDSVLRANVTWNISDDNMVYFTWSEGYRPGGVQRRPTFGNYDSDFLTNTEFGWKTQWLENRLQINGAVFAQDWDDIQIGLTGENAITLVDNGPSASVDGIEVDMLWLATDRLKLSASAAFYDSQLEDDYCCYDKGPDEIADTGDETPLAPKGTRLPVTADFKANMIARYHFPIGSFDSYVQGAMVYQGDRDSDLNQFTNAITGILPSYTTLDLAAGFGKDDWNVDVFVSNATGEDAPLYYTAQCTAETCGPQTYGVRIRPMTISAQFRMDFN
jgi:iron complex outermembrane receptor protein